MISLNAERAPSGHGVVSTPSWIVPAFWKLWRPDYVLWNLYEDHRSHYSSHFSNDLSSGWDILTKPNSSRIRMGIIAAPMTSQMVNCRNTTSFLRCGSLPSHKSDRHRQKRYLKLQSVRWRHLCSPNTKAIDSPLPSQCRDYVFPVGESSDELKPLKRSWSITLFNFVKVVFCVFTSSCSHMRDPW